jgi:hypothetical protein
MELAAKGVEDETKEKHNHRKRNREGKPYV